MNYIAIDTSDSHLTVIVKKGESVKEYFTTDSGSKHSVMLMPILEELLNEQNMTVSDSDFFAVVTGAGSFTGIRIGISTVKGFMMATKKPVLSVTSFDTLSYNKQGKVLAVIDARHDAFYVCGYDDGKVVYQPEFISLERLKELSKKFEYVVSSSNIPVEHEIVSRLDGLKKYIEKNYGDVSTDPESVVPLYIRKSQAEENR